VAVVVPCLLLLPLLLLLVLVLVLVLLVVLLVVLVVVLVVLLLLLLLVVLLLLLLLVVLPLLTLLGLTMALLLLAVSSGQPPAAPQCPHAQCPRWRARCTCSVTSCSAGRSWRTWLPPWQTLARRRRRARWHGRRHRRLGARIGRGRPHLLLV
jgi:hypothetical protein